MVFYGKLIVLVAIWFSLVNVCAPKRATPNMTFYPKPRNKEDSTLIWLQGTDTNNSYQNWYNNVMEILSPYYTPGNIQKGNVSIKRCSYKELPTKTEVCEVDLKSWGACSREQFFNYHRKSPCIFLQLNNISGWIPEYYDDPKHLPSAMPIQLKEHIRNLSSEERKTIWVSCKGENPVDVELLGPIQYYPAIQGFPGYYFPYRHSEDYLNPLIAVRFLRPFVGIIINIECKAWAKNIDNTQTDKMGSVHFELLID